MTPTKLKFLRQLKKILPGEITFGLPPIGPMPSPCPAPQKVSPQFCTLRISTKFQ
jgi:hypothetical protein